MMWLRHRNIWTTCLVIADNLLYVFHVRSLDLNRFNSVLKCFIDFQAIVKYVIPPDIDYTQTCTTPITRFRHPEKTLIKGLYITATIASSIKMNNLHVKHIERIQDNRVAHIPPHAIWMGCQWHMVYSPSDRTYMDDICGSDTPQRLGIAGSVAQGLHRRLMSLPNNHRTSSLTYGPCRKSLNQGGKPFNTLFSFLDDEKTLPKCGYASSSPL